jgi:hypothetical protein
MLEGSRIYRGDVQSPRETDRIDASGGQAMKATIAIGLVWALLYAWYWSADRFWAWWFK